MRSATTDRQASGPGRNRPALTGHSDAGGTELSRRDGRLPGAGRDGSCHLSTRTGTVTLTRVVSALQDSPRRAGTIGISLRNVILAVVFLAAWVVGGSDA